MTDLRALAGECLDWIKAHGAGLEAEIYLSSGEERSVELREGRVEAIERSDTEGAGLRLLSGGRMGFAAAGGLSLEAVQGLFEKVRAQLGHLEADGCKAFPAGPADGADAALADSLWDETLFSEEWENILPRLQEMQSEAKSSDKRIKSVLRIGYEESRGEVVIANTRGLLTYERGGSASVGLSALGEDDGEIETGSAYQASRKTSALDFKKVAGEAASRTVALLGARKLPSGRRAVVFDPWMAGEFLDMIAGLLCADEVQRGKSLLAGRLGQKMGSELVTFIDDPRRPGGMASSLYDDEGCPTRNKVMIEKGVVREFFHDTYTANKDARATNASAVRGSYRGLPTPSSSNFYLAPGDRTREDILSDTSDGILVLEVMGMHTADPISGEFSVGVSGRAIERGRLTHAVKSAMISGNLVELLGRVDAVGEDLTFYGSLGSPTLRISHMTVA